MSVPVTAPTVLTNAQDEERSGWRRWSWVLFGVFVVHQAEEVLAANLTAPASGGEPPPFAISEVEGFTGFVAVLTVVQLAQLVIATAGPFRVWKPWIVAVMATSMLINVLVPHVPGAIAAGGYHPGVVTAVLLFVPSSVAYLGFLRGHDLISTRGILVCFAISLGMLMAAVGAL